MTRYVYLVIEIIAVGGSISSIIYYLAGLWCASAFLREQREQGTEDKACCRQPATPAVSILKPLKGYDPGMYDSLRSHCLQDYPEYEIIFGASDPNDPAILLVE